MRKFLSLTLPRACLDRIEIENALIVTLNGVLVKAFDPVTTHSENHKDMKCEENDMVMRSIQVTLYEMMTHKIARDSIRNATHLTLI